MLINFRNFVLFHKREKAAMKESDKNQNLFLQKLPYQRDLKNSEFGNKIRARNFDQETEKVSMKEKNKERE